MIFLDEMGVLLGIMRPRARSKKGERSYDIKPFYRGSRLTLVGAISNKNVIQYGLLKDWEALRY